MNEEIKRRPGRPRKNEVVEKAPSSPNAVKPELEEDIRKANVALNRMRKVEPDVAVGSLYVSPREVIQKRVCPESMWQGKPTSDRGQGRKGNKPPVMSMVWARQDMHKDMIAQGWIPVVEDGEHVQHGGDHAYKRPVEFSKMHRERASKLSQAQVRQQDEVVSKVKAEGIAVLEDNTEFGNITSDELASEAGTLSD